jgi:carboxylesterase type B
MGESAGGGSIVHHLTAFGGKLKPLFKRAIIQSPAWNIDRWDRKGNNEATYQTFLKEARCTGKGIACLRALPYHKIKFAQEQTIKQAPAGTWGFGPAADGKFVRQLPHLELASGNHVEGVESIIITHVTDEAGMFTAKDANYTEASFKEYLDWEFANNTAITNEVARVYRKDQYQDQRSRMVDYTMHSAFTCVNRAVADAFTNITRMAVYEGGHGSDIVADFWDPTSMIAKVSAIFSGSTIDAEYQKYLVSFAQTGSPNTEKSPTAPEWKFIKNGQSIGEVLEVTKRFRAINDLATTKKDCHFLTDVFAAATAAQRKSLQADSIPITELTIIGVTPPGALVLSKLSQPYALEATADYGRGGEKALAELLSSSSSQ